MVSTFQNVTEWKSYICNAIHESSNVYFLMFSFEDENNNHHTRIGPVGPFRDSWSSQVVIFSPFQCLRVVGGKPAASVQFLLNPDPSARAI
jgi:hypothetical protein